MFSEAKVPCELEHVARGIRLVTARIKGDAVMDAQGGTGGQAGRSAPALLSGHGAAIIGGTALTHCKPSLWRLRFLPLMLHPLTGDHQRPLIPHFETPSSPGRHTHHLLAGVH